MRKDQLGIICLVVCALLAFSSPALARDWNVGDSDLPEQLQGLNQEQLNIVNKMDELNPAQTDSFNPAALQFFLSTIQTPAVVRTADGTTVLPPVDPKVSDSIGGVPSGVGTPPAASDGPVTHVGEPPAGPRSDFNFWNRGISGSGGMFGDGVRGGFWNTTMMSSVLGNDSVFDLFQSDFSFMNDSTVRDLVANGNIPGAQDALSNALGGQQVVVDPRGSGH